ncbi:MAG: hypothetical protein QOH36_2145 [Actinomycetota bacterium]|nr:hypothetical protein [Actinomycetota bacterium]
MRRLVVLVVAALVATSCGGGSDGKDKDPSPTSTPSTTAVIEVTTAPPPTEAVPETTVARGTPRTNTTALSTEMGPGTARIVGTVNGPEGPVTGAIVKVERFVGAAVATVQVQSQAGAWSVDSILGGSYKVTIFRPPDLAQTVADVFFLGADESKTLTTTLVRLGTNSITASIEPNPPLVGLPAVLTVRFGNGTVDANGQATFVPRPGVRVQLSLAAGMSNESSPLLVSDGTGAVAWQIRCLAPGPFPASLIIGNASSALVLPPCTAAPPPPAAPATTTP